MLALRPLIALIALVVVPLASTYVLLQAERPVVWRYTIVAVLALVSLALLRGAVIQPLWALRRWRRIADEHGFTFFGDLSHEPVLRGERDGRRFVAGVSAHVAQPGDPNRYRTIVSSPVEEGVPLGLRVYARSDATWVHDLSGRREVATGDATLESSFRVEGQDSEQVRDYVTDPEKSAALLAFAEKHPGLLVHGAESEELPAEPGGASGLVTLAVPGRVLDGVELLSYIDEVCELAALLDGA